MSALESNKKIAHEFSIGDDGALPATVEERLQNYCKNQRLLCTSLDNRMIAWLTPSELEAIKLAQLSDGAAIGDVLEISKVSAEPLIRLKRDPRFWDKEIRDFPELCEYVELTLAQACFAEAESKDFTARIEKARNGRLQLTFWAMDLTSSDVCVTEGDQQHFSDLNSWTESIVDDLQGHLEHDAETQGKSNPVACDALRGAEVFEFADATDLLEALNSFRDVKLLDRLAIEEKGAARA